jgi:hypothetical protein
MVKPSDYGNDLFDRTKSNLLRIDAHNRGLKNAKRRARFLKVKNSMVF